MRALNEIIVHCSATRADWMQGQSIGAKVAEIKRWHTAKPPVGRGWNDIGYHFLIDRDGTVAAGRPLGTIGAHVQGHNTGTIGICLLGGHGSSKNDDPRDNFTDLQLTSLRGRIKLLMEQYPTITKISGHNQYAAKACPGFHVPTWWKSVPAVDWPKAPPAREVPKQSVKAPAVIGTGLSVIGAYLWATACEWPFIAWLFSSCGN